mgnify:CR=1 FL=1
MSKLFSERSILTYLNTSKGATTVTLSVLIVMAIVVIASIIDKSSFEVLQKVFNTLIRISGKFIGRRELNYNRDLEIGKINEKMTRVKIYRFLNDLIIDLDLKRRGATPYQFLFVCIVASFMITVVLCQILFGSLWMIIVMFPIVFAGFMCIMYTKANVSHDTRIENVIESENIICNNIKDGVVVAIRNCINVIPIQIRGDYENFLDNIEHKNYHIRTALMELNQHLGSVSDDFIKKCIVFETEEEHGIVGMFQDVVEINNIKMEMRTEMKRKFEEVTTDFIIGASMIFLFLGAVLAIYKDVAHFYLKTPVGQVIIALDALIMIGEFVYITYLRAKEI